MTPDEVVRKFRETLVAAWDQVGQFDEFQQLDWMQATWEVLVEGTLCNASRGEYLAYYGDGAEVNSNLGSKRVWNPEARPTHMVACIPKAGQDLRDVISGDLTNRSKASRT